MKNKLLLFPLLLSAWGARAQTVTLAQESFETNGEGTRYTSNSFDLRTSAASVAGAFPYFTRALTNPLVNPLNPAYVSFGTNAYPVTIGNVTGSVFWAAEAVESTATTPAATDRPPGVVTLNPINASNYASLTMTVALADARGPSSPTITQGGLNPQNETNDFIRLQYSTDGGATYNTIGQFVGNNSTGTGQGYLQRDVNLDGIISSFDGAQSATNTLDINLRDFSFNIPGSPTALLVRVQLDQRGASEELAFDNIRVTGVLNTVAPPALANIESNPLNYLEGQAATQITNSLTVTNAAGNLSGATVAISSGRAAGQDVLIFINQNGITGSFNTSTGILTLSGTASAATYQTALRSVAYQNTNSANATAGTRTIQFVVANGGVTSGVASRNVVVTSALDAATVLPYREDFTTDGEGTRYASNTFSLSTTGAAWLRTSTNPYQTAATTQAPTTFSGISNSFYWYGNNTNSTANPSRVGKLQTLPINTAGYANLNFSLLLGASSGANASWQTADYFRVSYRQVGTNTWIPLIQFRGNSTVVAGQGNLQRDADPAATPSSPAPTGTTLTPALASFSAALPSAVAGQTLEFQLVLAADDIRAELAFDNLQLTGTQLAAPTVTTATPSSITSTSFVLGGSVTNDGGAAVTDRGVVYSSTNTTPTIGGSDVIKDANGTGTGTYSKLIGSLTPSATYTARAYATNSVGTSYGNAVTFGPAPVSSLLSIERVFSNPINTSIALYQVTFSVPVQGLTLLNFSITTTGNVAGASLQNLSSSGTGTTYIVGVNTGTGDGTLTLYLANAQGIRPGLSTPLPGAGTTYVIDKTPPTVTISTTATDPTSSTPIPFTVTFSESVTGFTASDIAVTNGTITSALSNVGNAYSFTVTPTASGLVTVNVAANGAVDAAFNGNIAASPLSLTYMVPVTATIWTGAVSTDWYTSGNWTAGVPTTTVDATINPVSTGRYPLVTSGTASARNLTINAGARLNMTDGTLDVRGNWTNNSSFVATGGTVALGTSTLGNIVGSGTTRFWSLRAEANGILLATSAGATVQELLTLNGEFSTNGNSFTLLSNATGTALVVNNSSNVVRGAVTVQRYIDPSLNPGLGYRHYSSPVANTTVADLTTASFTPVLNAAYNTSPTPNDVTPFPTVLGYDQALVNRINATPNFDKGFFSPPSTSTPLVPGHGYDVHIGAAEVVDFVGTLNNGDISVPMARSEASTLNAADAGWQFLGNPYPAPFDYSQVAAADRAGLEDAIYVYSSTGPYSGQYRAFVNGIGSGNPVIPVAQGFFARLATPSTTSTFTFRNSQRLTAPNATTFQRTAADSRPLIQLELGRAGSLADNFYAYAEAGATSAFDAAYDAAKLPNSSGLNLASLVGSEYLAIEGRATFTTATSIPLTMSVPAAGTYSLSAVALRNLSPDLHPYLHDRQTGQTVLLTVGSPYSFRVTAAQTATPIMGRFSLQFNSVAALPNSGITEVSIYPNPAHERFTVQLPAVAAASEVQAELRNTLGQVVRRQTAAQSTTGTTLTLETTGLTTGVYLLRLQAGDTTLTKRVVVQ